MKQFVLLAVVIALMGSTFVLIISPLSVSFPHVEIGTFSFPKNETVVEPEPENTTLLVTGDVMLARDVENKMNQLFSEYPFLEMRDVFAAHDHVLINFEASIPETHVHTPSMTMQFSVDDQDVTPFTELGITHATLANNHARDYGIAGLEHTQSVLKENGVESFGQPYSLATSSVYFLETSKKTIAFIGIDLVLSKPSDNELKAVFAFAEENSDEQFVIVHWGDEYVLTHNAAQEAYAKKFVDLGADLVIGHHPHVVQDIQKVGDVLVFYSLGNFVFDQYFNKDVQEGLLLSFDIATTTSITLLPVSTIGSRTQPRAMPLFEQSLFLEALAKRSNESLKTSILQGKIDI